MALKISHDELVRMTKEALVAYVLSLQAELDRLVASASGSRGAGSRPAVVETLRPSPGPDTWRSGDK